MSIKRGLSVTVLIFFYVVINCYPSKMVKVTSKWIYYPPTKEIRIIIRGIDEEGHECSRYKIFPPGIFFPNGYFYEYGMFNLYDWYGCQMIHEKEGKYYVVGFAVFEILSYGDHIEAHLAPCFLFNWGFNIKRQEIYLDINLDQCYEISEEQIKPFSLKKVKEKFIYDKLHGNEHKYKQSSDLENIDTEEYMDN